MKGDMENKGSGIKRLCRSCGLHMKFNDERYEIKKIGFSMVKGIRNKIVFHLCKECYDKHLKPLEEKGSQS